MLNVLLGRQFVSTVLMSNSVFSSGEFTCHNQSFCCKPLTLNDLPLVLGVELRAHKTPWKESHLCSSLTQHQCIGVWSGSKLCGYGIVSFVVGEAELLLFVLDVPWQGRGIAKRFLQKLLCQAKLHAQQMYLEVREGNAAAIALYESVGFNQVGVRPNYYPAGKGLSEDAYIYALELSFL